MCYLKKISYEAFLQLILALLHFITVAFYHDIDDSINTFSLSWIFYTDTELILFIITTILQ